VRYGLIIAVLMIAVMVLYVGFTTGASLLKMPSAWQIPAGIYDGGFADAGYYRTYNLSTGALSVSGTEYTSTPALADSGYLLVDVLERR